MKSVYLFFFISLFTTSLHSQIVTVQVIESFEYEYKPSSYNITIIEKLPFNNPFEEDRQEAERKQKFDSNMSIVYKYLEENKVAFKEVKEKKDLSLLPPNAIPMNYVKLDISSPKTEIDKLQKMVNGLEDIRINNQDYMISVDDAFMQSCMESLTTSARNKAEMFARGLNSKTGDIHEIKIIKHQVTKLKNNAHLVRANKNSTHKAHFTMEYSFETI